MIANFIFPFFLLCIAVQLGYALYFFCQVFKISVPTSSITDNKPVSIIICAKNEARNLEAHLPAIMVQRYSNDAGNTMYEVIVVNDASTDDTKEVLALFQTQYDNIKVINIAPDEERTLPGKKFALSKAIAATDNTFLLLTDADCAPVSAYWLQAMVAPLQEGKEIVAGYGGYHYRGGFLNAFIRWETLHSFMQYAGYAIAGKPYMAVGRNIACTKAAMQKAQQSAVWSELPSGDDDLLIQAAGNKDNMVIVASPDTITISKAKDNWMALLQQKKRHVSTGKYYKTGTKLLLAMYAGTHAATWICFLVLLFRPFIILAIAVMLLRLVVQALLLNHITKLTDERFDMMQFVWADILWMVYNFVLSPYILLKNKQQWT